MFSTPLTASSIGPATVSAIVRGFAPGIVRRDLHRRRHDVRVLADRQARDRHESRDEDQRRQHRREDRAVDEDPRKVGVLRHRGSACGAAAGPAAGGGRFGWSIGTACGFTGWPGKKILRMPLMITLSPALRPDSTTTQPLDVRPERDVAALRRVLVADDVDVAPVLVGQHGLLVDQERVLLRLAEEPHAREQARREDAVRVRHARRARGSCRSSGFSALSTKSISPLCGKPSSSARPTSTGLRASRELSRVARARESPGSAGRRARRR